MSILIQRIVRTRPELLSTKVKYAIVYMLLRGRDEAELNSVKRSVRGHRDF